MRWSSWMAVGAAALALGGVAGAAGKPSFASVKCWDPLRWSMNVGAAEKALKDAGHAPRREETRGYFPDPGLGVAHTTEVDLLFAVHGWKGMVRFDDRERMFLIDISGEKLSEMSVTSELSALEAKFGAPAERTGGAASRRLHWRNETTWLTVNAVRGEDMTWTVSKTWVPAPPTS